MANAQHVEIYHAGAVEWNRWRALNPDVVPDLEGADLQIPVGSGACVGMDFSGGKLADVDLRGVDLTAADLGPWVWASKSRMSWAPTDLSGADLRAVRLCGANLREARLVGVDLSDADLTEAVLNRANLEKAILKGCVVYGVSAWDVKLDGAVQADLEITYSDWPPVTVDDLELAQFIYLLIDNKKVSKALDATASKVVLMLGRFTPDRKSVLDVAKQQLRKLGLIPVVFDFQRPDHRDTSETVQALAHLASFVLADITEPRSVPHELASIVPDLCVPVQPILQTGVDEPYGMFADLRRKYHWVLPVCLYSDVGDLLQRLRCVILPAVRAKNRELDARRQSEEAGNV